MTKNEESAESMTVGEADRLAFAIRQIEHGNGVEYCVREYLPEPLRSTLLAALERGWTPWSDDAQH